MSDVVAIDARPLCNPDGEAYAYTLNLVHSLAYVDQETRYHLFFDREPDPACLPRADNVAASVLKAPSVLWKASALPVAAEQIGARLLHVQGLLPAAPRIPVVTTIRHFEPLRVARRYPRRIVWAWRHLLPRQTHRAAAVIVPWRSVQDELIRGLRVDPERVHIVPYGVEPAFTPQCDSAHALVAQRLRLPGRYLIGRAGSREGAQPILAVWRRARAKHGLEAGLALDVDAPAADGVYRVPAIDDRIGPLLLSGAIAAVLGGVREADALALMESAACGCPVVGQANPVFEEILGDAGVFGDEGEQAAGLARLAADDDERARRMRRGLARVKPLTWPAMAERTIEIYRGVLNGKGDPAPFT